MNKHAILVSRLCSEELRWPTPIGPIKLLLLVVLRAQQTDLTNLNSRMLNGCCSEPDKECLNFSQIDSRRQLVLNCKDAKTSKEICPGELTAIVSLKHTNLLSLSEISQFFNQKKMQHRKLFNATKMIMLLIQHSMEKKTAALPH